MAIISPPRLQSLGRCPADIHLLRTNRQIFYGHKYQPRDNPRSDPQPPPHPVFFEERLSGECIDGLKTLKSLFGKGYQDITTDSIHHSTLSDSHCFYALYCWGQRQVTGWTTVIHSLHFISRKHGVGSFINNNCEKPDHCSIYNSHKINRSTALASRRLWYRPSCKLTEWDEA